MSAITFWLLFSVFSDQIIIFEQLKLASGVHCDCAAWRESAVRCRPAPATPQPTPPSPQSAQTAQNGELSSAAPAQPVVVGGEV